MGVINPNNGHFPTHDKTFLHGVLRSNQILQVFRVIRLKELLVDAFFQPEQAANPGLGRVSKAQLNDMFAFWEKLVKSLFPQRRRSIFEI